jgi:hypothetical protein
MNRNVLTTELPNQPPQLDVVGYTNAQSLLQQSPQPVRTAQSTRPQLTLSGVSAEIRDKDTGFLGWWYRLTCPRVTPDVAKSLQGREKIRKARLASLTILVMCGFIILPIPVGLINNNMQMVAMLLVTLGFYVLGLVCNRKGHLVLAGLLIILIFNLGLVLFLATFRDGMNVGTLPTYDLLLEGSLVSVAFFRPRSVFIVTVINIAIIVGTILLLPKAPDLVAFLRYDTYDVVVRPVILQLFGAFVVYVWVNSAYRAILRADRAEEVAELERREIERQEQEIEQKKQLDYGIDQILGSLNRLANGETNVKIPLDQNNILWRVGYSINNLLARIQAFREERAELARTKHTAAALTEALKYGQVPRLDRWTHTCLDELLIELHKISDRQQSHMGASPSRENIRNF